MDYYVSHGWAQPAPEFNHEKAVRICWSKPVEAGENDFRLPQEAINETHIEVQSNTMDSAANNALRGAIRASVEAGYMVPNINMPNEILLNANRTSTGSRPQIALASGQHDGMRVDNRDGTEWAEQVMVPIINGLFNLAGIGDAKRRFEDELNRILPREYSKVSRDVEMSLRKIEMNGPPVGSDWFKLVAFYKSGHVGLKVIDWGSETRSVSDYEYAIANLPRWRQEALDELVRVLTEDLGAKGTEED